METQNDSQPQKNPNELEQGNIEGLLQINDKVVDRAVGVLLGGMVGDILGSSVEGMPSAFIHSRGGIRNFIPGRHMGMEKAGLRFGMYTDDMNSTLALASSIVEYKGLLPVHAAHQYGRFWQSKPYRGYPGSAMAVMRAVLEGKDINETGRECFKDGSFANGGAMRISPVGIAFRNASDEKLHEAVRMAIISSHVHPEAIDGAWLQAKAISILSKLESPKDMTRDEFLNQMHSLSKTETMKKEIEVVQKAIEEDVQIPGIIGLLGDSFQLKTVDCMGSVFWTLATTWDDPEECIIKAVSLGGDTDTVAAITGALCGALHGTHWLPLRWYNRIENGERGRDYTVNLGKNLAMLDLEDILIETQQDMDAILEESKRIYQGNKF